MRRIKIELTARAAEMRAMLTDRTPQTRQLLGHERRKAREAGGAVRQRPASAREDEGGVRRHARRWADHRHAEHAPRSRGTPDTPAPCPCHRERLAIDSNASIVVIPASQSIDALDVEQAQVLIET